MKGNQICINKFTPFGKKYSKTRKTRPETRTNSQRAQRNEERPRVLYKASK
jgi:hypothetical protein